VRTREHVFDEPFVSRDIDDSRLRHIGKVQMSKAQIDGDPALLFLLQPVRILSHQCFDQTGLPVIDVAGGADDVGHKSILDFRSWICDSTTQSAHGLLYYFQTSKSPSFPNAFIGNPGETVTGPPINTFGGDNLG